MMAQIHAALDYYWSHQEEIHQDIENEEKLVAALKATGGNFLLVLDGFGAVGTGYYGFTARVAFSPDGRTLAANAWDGTINRWTLAEDGGRLAR